MLVYLIPKLTNFTKHVIGKNKLNFCNSDKKYEILVAKIFVIQIFAWNVDVSIGIEMYTVQVPSLGS